MGKKVKCKECAKSLHWALPVKVTEANYEYAKRCLNVASSSIVCGETTKTKPLQHEQYCKKYYRKTERDLVMESVHTNDIANLEEMIKEFEAQQKMNLVEVGNV